MRKSKIIIFLLMLAMLTPAFCFTAQGYTVSSELYGENYVLYSLDTDTVVASSNADVKLYPASLTKIVSAIIVYENCDDLDAEVTASYDAIHALDDTGSSTVSISVGETLTVRQLLYCMLVASANDAANVLAEYIAGDIDSFVDMMNDFAEELGCTDTHFDNPHGLDSETHYTTCNDMLVFTKYFMSISLLYEMSNTVTYTIPATDYSDERTLYTTIYLINSNRSLYYYSYAKGIKTGYTSLAGRNCISSATQNGYTYVAVVMGAPNEDVDGDGYNDSTAMLDVKTLFKWAFSNLTLTQLADTTTFIAEAEISLSAETDYVRLVPAETVYALVPSGVDASSVDFECTINENITAPVSKGDVLGHAEILYAQEVIAEVDLVAGESVSASGFLYVLSLLEKTAKSNAFIGLVIAAASIFAIFAIYQAVKYYTRAHKYKQRKRRIDRQYEESDSFRRSIIEKEEAEARQPYEAAEMYADDVAPAVKPDKKQHKREKPEKKKKENQSGSQHHEGKKSHERFTDSGARRTGGSSDVFASDEEIYNFDMFE